MSAGKKGIPRNMARIEFLACRELIESLLAQGFDKKKIHARLTENGQITMSYDALCKVLLKVSMNKLSIQSITAPVLPSAPPLAPSGAKRPDHPGAAPVNQQGPRIVTPTLGKCPDPRDMNPEDAL
jgi:hypothetical protein